MSHSTHYFPQSIKHAGRWKHWFTGSFIGNLACAAENARQHRKLNTSPDGAPLPNGTVIRRHHCSVNYYL